MSLMSVAAEPQLQAVLSSAVIDATVRKVLVYRLGSLGDTVVALPSLHLIAQAFPNAERRLLTNVPVVARAPAAAAVLGHSALIHSYEIYPTGSRNPLALVRLLLRLRRFQPEVAVYLKSETSRSLSQRDRQFLRLTGAQRIVGVLPTGEVRARQAADGNWEPEAERLLRSLSELGSVDTSSRGAWDLQLTQEEIDRADAVLAPFSGTPFFAVSIGTKVQAKHWGTANWSNLLHEMGARHPNHGLLLVGAPDERAESDAAASAWVHGNAGPIINACGVLTPRESAAALRGARAFVGHDSGPMHLAASAGVPVIAIFAARNLPRTWFPQGSIARVLYHQVDCAGCGLEACVEQRKKCLLSITAQEVLQAMDEVLALERTTR